MNNRDIHEAAGVLIIGQHAVRGRRKLPLIFMETLDGNLRIKDLPHQFDLVFQPDDNY
jgi:hypothetical protein